MLPNSKPNVSEFLNEMVNNSMKEKPQTEPFPIIPVPIPLLVHILMMIAAALSRRYFPDSTSIANKQEKKTMYKRFKNFLIMFEKHLKKKQKEFKNNQMVDRWTSAYIFLFFGNYTIFSKRIDP